MKYRKKPVVIDAVRWDGIYTVEGAPEWFREAVAAEKAIPRDDGQILIFTLEGCMAGFPGDMIIRGVKGELYPIKYDIFDATYDPA